MKAVAEQCFSVTVCLEHQEWTAVNAEAERRGLEPHAMLRSFANQGILDCLAAQRNREFEALVAGISSPDDLNALVNIAQRRSQQIRRERSADGALPDDFKMTEKGGR